MSVPLSWLAGVHVRKVSTDHPLQLHIVLEDWKIRPKAQKENSRDSELELLSPRLLDAASWIFGQTYTNLATSFAMHTLTRSHRLG